MENTDKRKVGHVMPVCTTLKVDVKLHNLTNNFEFPSLTIYQLTTAFKQKKWSKPTTPHPLLNYTTEASTLQTFDHLMIGMTSKTSPGEHQVNK